MMNFAIVCLISTLVTTDTVFSFRPRPVKTLPVKYLSFRNSQSQSKSKLTCTDEGFFRHPDDCKKFYRCVDFSGEGRVFTTFRFDCAPGTVFDESISVCNHPSSVPACEATFDNENKAPHPDRPSALSSTSTSEPEVKTEGTPPCAVHQTSMRTTVTHTSGTKRPPITTGPTKSPSTSGSTKSPSTSGSTKPHPTTGSTKPPSIVSTLSPLAATSNTVPIDSGVNTQCTCGHSEAPLPNHLSTAESKPPFEEQNTPAPSTSSQVDDISGSTAHPDKITNAPTTGTETGTGEEDKGPTGEEDKGPTGEEDKGTDGGDKKPTGEEDKGTDEGEKGTTLQNHLSPNEPLDSTTESNSVSPFDEQNTLASLTDVDPTNSQVDGASDHTGLPDEDSSTLTSAGTTAEDDKIETSTEKKVSTTPADDFFLFQLQCGNRPGYRRHPMHCHRYYKCSSNGVQITFDLFTCDEGHVFDNAKEKCLPKDEAEPCNVVEENNNDSFRYSWRIQRPIHQVLGPRTR